VEKKRAQLPARIGAWGGDVHGFFCHCARETREKGRWPWCSCAQGTAGEKRSSAMAAGGARLGREHGEGAGFHGEEVEEAMAAGRAPC
jgi:hypothetical protein